MAGVEVDGVEGMKTIVGQEIGPSDSRTVTQELIDAFADVSGDHQWIHVDPERAKAESPYGVTIAHGNLTLSLADSFVSSAFFSLIAAATLDYYFLPPILSLEIDSAEDISALGTFLLTSFVITSLVRRLQQSSTTLRRQAQLLDLTHDLAIPIAAVPLRNRINGWGVRRGRCRRWGLLRWCHDRGRRRGRNRRDLCRHSD